MGFLAVMANGFVSISSDYMGYGSSKAFRNYLVRDTYVTATMPLWIKTASFLREDTESKTALADAAFYFGYSEGGYASVAIADGLLKSIAVQPLRVMAGAGPYRMKDGTNIKNGVAGNDAAAIDDKLAYILALLGAAYSVANPNSMIRDTLKGQSLLNSAFMDPNNIPINVINWLAETTMDRFEMSTRLTSKFGDDLVDDIWSPLLVKIIRDSNAANVNFCYEENIQTGVSDHFCTVLAQNDLIETLETADYPIEICHSVDDELSLYANVPNVTSNPNLTLIQITDGLLHKKAATACFGVGFSFLANYNASLFVIKDKHVPGRR
jgi:hypothetical protein